MSNIYRSLSESYKTIYEGPGEFGQTPRSDEIKRKLGKAMPDLKSKYPRAMNPNRSKNQSLGPRSISPNRNAWEFDNKVKSALENPKLGKRFKGDLLDVQKRVRSNDEKEQKNINPEDYDYEKSKSKLDERFKSRYGGQMSDIYDMLIKSANNDTYRGLLQGFDNDGEIDPKVIDSLRSKFNIGDEVEEETILNDLSDYYNGLNNPIWLRNRRDFEEQRSRNSTNRRLAIDDKLSTFSGNFSKKLEKLSALPLDKDSTLR